MGNRSRVLAGAALAVLGVVVGLSILHRVTTPKGSAGTDGSSRTMATAIAYPRPDDAAGYARAVLRNAAFTVLEAEDLGGDGTSGQPWVRLVWRIHAEPSRDGMFSVRSDQAYDACYRVEFDRYEATAIDRIDCPRGATPVRLPPRPVESPAPTPVTGATPTCLGVIQCSQVGG